MLRWGQRTRDSRQLGDCPASQVHLHWEAQGKADNAFREIPAIEADPSHCALQRDSKLLRGTAVRLRDPSSHKYVSQGSSSVTAPSCSAQPASAGRQGPSGHKNLLFYST